jgi:arylformamidase
MTVFRHYTQDELELQYDSGARSPELTARRDARTLRVDAESERVRATTPGARLDIAYGGHPREKIDYFPASTSGGPLMAFIHGGYWKMRSKSEFAWMAPAFTSRGVNLATIGYPLCPDVRIGDIVGSVRRALVFLHSEAAGLDFDPARIHVAGHSAGGHLTAMMTATDFSKHGGPADLVKSATCVSGLYDLEPLRLVKHNRELRISDADIGTLSPVRLKPRDGVVVNLTVGDQEADEFVRNTVELGDAWRKAGGDVTMVEARGLYHFDILDHFAGPGKPIHERVMSVIEHRQSRQ